MERLKGRRIELNGIVGQEMTEEAAKINEIISRQDKLEEAIRILHSKKSGTVSLKEINQILSE